MVGWKNSLFVHEVLAQVVCSDKVIGGSACSKIRHDTALFSLAVWIHELTLQTSACLSVCMSYSSFKSCRKVWSDLLGDVVFFINVPYVCMVIPRICSEEQELKFYFLLLIYDYFGCYKPQIVVLPGRCRSWYKNFQHRLQWIKS